MGMWSLLAFLVVVVFLLYGGRRVYHKRKAKRDKFKTQSPDH